MDEHGAQSVEIAFPRHHPLRCVAWINMFIRPLTVINLSRGSTAAEVVDWKSYFPISAQIADHVVIFRGPPTPTQQATPHSSVYYPDLIGKNLDCCLV